MFTTFNILTSLSVPCSSHKTSGFSGSVPWCPRIKTSTKLGRMPSLASFNAKLVTLTYIKFYGANMHTYHALFFANEAICSEPLHPRFTGSVTSVSIRWPLEVTSCPMVADPPPSFGILHDPINLSLNQIFCFKVHFLHFWCLFDIDILHPLVEIHDRLDTCIAERIPNNFRGCPLEHSFGHFLLFIVAFAIQAVSFLEDF